MAVVTAVWRALGCFTGEVRDMHKKEMRNWMFIISIFLLVACDEVAYLRNDEKPVLVLNAVLEAGCDSMRIELTETKGAYDQSPWQRFPEAEVRSRPGSGSRRRRCGCMRRGNY